MMRGALICLTGMVLVASCGGSVRTAPVVSTAPTKPTPAPTTATRTPPPPAPPVPSGVVADAEKSVVAIGCPSGAMLSSGSGFKAAKFGFIVTAAHVARACSVGGTLDVGGGRGGVVGFDPTHDLALLDSPSANLGPSLALATHPAYAGEAVAILGFPGGLGRLVASRGIVIATGWSVTTNEPGYRESLTDAIEVIGSVRPGDSGGPVIDRRGHVVGVVEIGASNRRIGYLTPAADVASEPAPP